MQKTPVVPIFPLPGLVVFPRTLLPLHIFEPRYARMVKDALEGEKRIATAHLKRGWEKDYYGKPRVYRTITVCRILHSEVLPENRYNIILEGIERAEVVEEPPAHGYRRVKYQPLLDEMPSSEEGRARLNDSLGELLEMSERLGRLQPEMRKFLTNLENTHLHPGIIADQVASVLVREPYDRQSLLETTSVERRLRLLNVQLRGALATTPGGG